MTVDWTFSAADLLQLLAFVASVLGAFFALRGKVDVAITEFKLHATGMEKRVDHLTSAIDRIDARLGDQITRNGALDQRVTDHGRRLSSLERAPHGRGEG